MSCYVMSKSINIFKALDCCILESDAENSLGLIQLLNEEFTLQWQRNDIAVELSVLVSNHKNTLRMFFELRHARSPYLKVLYCISKEHLITDKHTKRHLFYYFAHLAVIQSPPAVVCRTLLETNSCWPKEMSTWISESIIHDLSGIRQTYGHWSPLPKLEAVLVKSDLTDINLFLEVS